jgi:hypothetical protein
MQKTINKNAVIEILLLFFGLSLVSCRLPNWHELNFTRTEPKSADIIGTWHADENSKEAMRENGYDVSIPTSLILKDDGVFVLANAPDWLWDSFGESHKQLETFEGRWSISSYSDKGFWQVDLKSSKGLPSAQLVGQKPPYLLDFTIGDADNNESMILVRQ